jgi:carboxyl-terminal processing protease
MFMKISMFPSKRIQQLVVASAFLLVFGAGFALGSLNSVIAQSNTQPPNDPEIASRFDYFWQTFNYIRTEYLHEVDIDALVEGAVVGMVDSLDDDYSGYMTPETYTMLNEELEGEIQGIGVVIRTIEETGEIEVVGVLEGTPAKAAGILRGDIFYAIDGEEVADMTQMELAAAVRGLEGTSLTITMRRGDELIDFAVMRARIIIPNVEYEIIDDFAYLRLNQFSSSAREDMNDALEAMEIDQRSGLIIDFRDNPGGLLSSAIDVASLLIDAGPVVIEDFGNGQEQVFNARGDALEVDLPVVLLVNGSSASGSELVAGVWQEMNRVTVIGETTFGKGTVQTWHDLNNGGGLRITIARWLTPEGTWIHETGVKPDIVVEWTPLEYDDPDDPQLEAAIQHLNTLTVEAQAPTADMPIQK